MMPWTFAEIENKIRLTTGRPDASMMTRATILTYVNQVYQYVIPKELKISWGYTYYQFYTQANVDQYVGPVQAFQTINPQAWVDGFGLEWYASPDLFYQDYRQELNKQTVATGNGSQNNFTFPITYFPILPFSVYVTDGTQVVQDNGQQPNGSFSQVPIPPGGGGGTIDYATGTVSNLSFINPPAANTTLTATFETYQPNRPRAILYFQSQPLPDAVQTSINATNVFVLRPVPDQVYLVKMQGIQIPPPFVNDSDVPFRADMGPMIAYAASLEIFADFNQMQQYNDTLPLYEKYKNVSMQDTYEELLYQRSVPAF
jgi:hypothetical protein